VKHMYARAQASSSREGHIECGHMLPAICTNEQLEGTWSVVTCSSDEL
jgi:hypothetical protein